MTDTYRAKVPVDFRLRPEVIAQVDAIAATYDTTRSEVLRWMVTLMLDDERLSTTLKGRP